MDTNNYVLLWLGQLKPSKNICLSGCCCSSLLCLKEFMSAYSPQAKSRPNDMLTPSFNPCLAAHPTAWVSYRGQDGKVTVSLFVPRAEGNKLSILVPKEA